ncbi:MAG: ornithine cyclodeaminase [Blastopirellula sp.]|nr:MAG: ornithine cyclodeaminase [Blastopirellula sp.]
MAAKFYQESEVAQLLEMPATIEVVEECFKQLALGNAENVPRRRSRTQGFVLHDMSATAGYLGVSGWKQYTTTKEKARFLVGLYDCASGELLAIFEADQLGQFRTGASTGVASRYLAAGGIHQVGLIGTGWQAETQLTALAAVHSLRQVFVYSRDIDKRTSFAEKMADSLGIEVIPVHEPRKAVEDLPVVVTATTSKTPVLEGNWLAEGALVCAAGANWLFKAEIDQDTILRADNIVCDSIEACRLEAGDFVAADEANRFDWDKLVTLGSVIAGQKVGRDNAQSIVLYESLGLSLQDVALADWLLKKAKGRPDLGTDLPF